uniref:histidine kinase n=1 Tax=uncultured bacterium Contig12 TaxID=1393397 RepID=W0FIU4_9BACT|nr:integral membrane sensor signal transduction histidine kinase [uncultured bacterium Contig12]
MKRTIRRMGEYCPKKAEEFIHATQEVAKGNFDVRIDEHTLAGKSHMMAESFNLMAGELAKIEIFRTDFIENMSHEYKTPLMAIEGYATLLRNENLPEEKRMEYTQKILDNTRRLSLLSSNILLLSRLEHHEQRMEKEAFRLDEQLREVILGLENQWTKKRLVMEIDLEDCVFIGGVDFLEIAWQNIIGNAVKFTPEGGTVSIRLNKSEAEITVSIADSGPGMSKETLQRIFEKYYQGDTSRFFHGNGLGLTLARRTVDLHGGSIEVKSQPGKGTVFIVHLPANHGDSSIV